MFTLKQNEDHGDRKDQNVRNTALIAFIVYTLNRKENAFHVHGFIGLS